jgi:hypothetical protein
VRALTPLRSKIRRRNSVVVHDSGRLVASSVFDAALCSRSTSHNPHAGEHDPSACGGQLLIVSQTMTTQINLEGWSLVRSNSTVDCSLLLAVKDRYGSTYEMWKLLTQGYKSIIRHDEKVWLFTDYDYAGLNDCPFTWNFIEKLEIDSAIGYDALIADSIEFWNDILPIGLSVVDDYEYYGIDKSGNFVLGRMPDSHEYRKVGNNFESFQLQLRNG